MRKNILLICNGLSGSGKTYFIKHFLDGQFYNLKSVTTRPKRPGEIDGDRYYFTTEQDFDAHPLATRLFVNEALWTPGKPKWLYGVPESEICDNLGRDMVYDVIQPRYTRQLIDWFDKHCLHAYYDYKVAWFLPTQNNRAIVQSRANMPDDMQVRQTNTCDATDFLNAQLPVDYFVQSSADAQLIPKSLLKMIKWARIAKGTTIDDYTLSFFRQGRNR